jgi:hypothetical protein
MDLCLTKSLQQKSSMQHRLVVLYLIHLLKELWGERTEDVLWVYENMHHRKLEKTGYGPRVRSENLQRSAAKHNRSDRCGGPGRLTWMNPGQVLRDQRTARVRPIEARDQSPDCKRFPFLFRLWRASAATSRQIYERNKLESLRAQLVGCERLDQTLGSQEAVDWIPGLHPKCGPHAR